MRRLLVLGTLLALLGCSDAREAGPNPSRPAAPTSSVTAAVTPAEDPTEDPLEALPTGPPPRIAYADGSVIVHPDGRRDPLPGQRQIGVSAFIPFRDGYLVADERYFEGTVGLAYVEGVRRENLGPCASGGAVPHTSGQRVAWVTQFCPEAGGDPVPTLVHVAATRGQAERQREVSRVGIVRVVGFLGDDVLVSGFAGGAQLVGPDGVETTVPRLDLATTIAVRRGLVAGVLRYGYAHGAVVDPRTGRLLWKQRHTYPVALSPDGTLLLADVHRRSTLLDAATGRVVAVVRASRLGLDGWVWEDGRHLLAVAYAGERQAMVRVDLRGTVTRVGPVVSSTSWRYVFETRH